MLRSQFRAWTGWENPVIAEEFLDWIEIKIESILLGKRSGQRTYWRRYFLNALKNPAARREIAAFLIMKKARILDAWDLQRKLIPIMKLRSEGGSPEEPIIMQKLEIADVQVNELAGAPKEIGVSQIEMERPEVRNERQIAELPVQDFYAKTYLIAAHLYFELSGSESEYDSLIRKKAELEIFVRDRFVDGKSSLAKLPGTLFDMKDFSYKKILAGKNASKKGQLRPSFRQIIENPQVFGADISDRASKVFTEHFMD